MRGIVDRWRVSLRMRQQRRRRRLRRHQSLNLLRTQTEHLRVRGGGVRDAQARWRRIRRRHPKTQSVLHLRKFLVLVFLENLIFEGNVT